MIERVNPLSLDEPSETTPPEIDVSGFGPRIQPPTSKKELVKQVANQVAEANNFPSRPVARADARTDTPMTPAPALLAPTRYRAGRNFQLNMKVTEKMKEWYLNECLQASIKEHREVTQGELLERMREAYLLVEAQKNPGR
jgi:hypothetical protein